MYVAEMLADMQMRGWAVTFQAFGTTRGLAISANRDDQQTVVGWMNTHEGALEEAIKPLYLSSGQRPSREGD
jgi:hypothetical protein